MSNNSSDVGAFLAGFIIGGLVGAATALILAPQSGEETRTRLMASGDNWRGMGKEQTDAVFSAMGNAGIQPQEQTRIVLSEGKTRITNPEDIEEPPA